MNTATEGVVRSRVAFGIAVVGLGSLASWSLPAQQPTAPPPVPEMGSASGSSAKEIRLAKGTLVRLLLRETISSKTARPGDMIPLQVLGDVKVDGLVVIPNRARAQALVMDVHPAGRAWRAGTLKIEVQPVHLLDGQTLALQAQSSAKGKPTRAVGDWAGAIMESGGGAILLLPLAPLQRGNEAIFAKGLVLETEAGADVVFTRSAVETAQPAPEERKQGDASVTIYFLKSAGPNTIDLVCGTAKLGKARVGSKMQLRLPAGTYYFRLGHYRDPIKFTFIDGGQYYLRLDMVQRFTSGWNWSLTEADPDVAELEASDMLPVEPRGMPNLSKLDLAELQASPPFKKRH